MSRSYHQSRKLKSGGSSDFIFEILITFAITIISFVVVFHRKAEYKELVTPILHKFKLTK